MGMDFLDCQNLANYPLYRIITGMQDCSEELTVLTEIVLFVILNLYCLAGPEEQARSKKR